MKPAANSNWAARQSAFVEERKRSRAEMCRCGHDRGHHQDDCAGCIRWRECDCFCFCLAANDNAVTP